MRFQIIAFALAFAIIWAGCILVVGQAEFIWQNYGLAFLYFAASIYPGYHPGTGISSVLIGTVYGFVDGAIGGALFAWIYNMLADRHASWLEIDPTFGGTIFRAANLPDKAYAVWSPFNETSDYFKPSTHPFMINLIVDDLSGVLQQAAQGGATLIGDPQELDYGRFGWFMDPEGNKVELWQPK